MLEVLCHLLFSEDSLPTKHIQSIQMLELRYVYFFWVMVIASKKHQIQAVAWQKIETYAAQKSYFKMDNFNDSETAIS